MITLSELLHRTRPRLHRNLCGLASPVRLVSVTHYPQDVEPHYGVLIMGKRYEYYALPGEFLAHQVEAGRKALAFRLAELQTAGCAVEPIYEVNELDGLGVLQGLVVLHDPQNPDLIREFYLEVTAR